MPVAFITGGGRGIGRAVALALAEDGYNVALVARSLEQLKETEALIGDTLKSSFVAVFPLDVSDSAAVEQAVQKTISEFGQIDLLFNNAGAHVQGSCDVSHEVFDQMLQVNIGGAFNCAKAIIPHMKQRSSGYIINVSSICGLHGFAGMGAYSAAKYGLAGLSECLFRELLPFGIRVTTLYPSWVNTQMARHGPMSDEEKIQPQDIVRTVRYLLSLSPGACINELLIQCSANPL